MTYPALDPSEVKAATDRVAGTVRPVALTTADDSIPGAAEVRLAMESLQHTGSFKARGAQNFLAAHREAGSLPDAGVTLASGGNAGLACAWAAQQQGVAATVFLPEVAPRVKVDRLRAYGADIRLVGAEYAEAAAACRHFQKRTGALASHAYDDPLIAAGAGTLLDEIRSQLPTVDTVLVAVGGGGLFTGIATAAEQHGIRVVGVEPEHCRALHAAVEAGGPVDVPVDSVAADSLGARRASAMAHHAALRTHTKTVLTSDASITATRRSLWEQHRLVVEHGAATALAGLTSGAYVPEDGATVCVVLCGANTSPGSLL